MRLYEAMYIVRPEVEDEELQALMARVADTIGQVGGTIDLHDVWERRELAYEIDGCTRGTYVICYFNAESTAIDALRHEMELEEQVLRHVTVVPNPKAIWRPVSATPPAEEAEEAQPEAEAAEAVAEPVAEAPAESPSEPEAAAPEESAPEDTPDEAPAEAAETPEA